VREPDGETPAPGFCCPSRGPTPADSTILDSFALDGEGADAAESYVWSVVLRVPRMGH